MTASAPPRNARHAAGITPAAAAPAAPAKLKHAAAHVNTILMMCRPVSSILEGGELTTKTGQLPRSHRFGRFTRRIASMIAATPVRNAPILARASRIVFTGHLLSVLN